MSTCYQVQINFDFLILASYRRFSASDFRFQHISELEFRSSEWSFRNRNRVSIAYATMFSYRHIWTSTPYFFEIILCGTLCLTQFLRSENSFAMYTVFNFFFDEFPVMQFSTAITLRPGIVADFNLSLF